MPLDPKIIPEHLKEIQPRPSQVWNCYDVGFDANGSWRTVVWTYKLFTEYRMWRTRIGERAPLLCTALIFTRFGGQCFMPPVIFYLAENYNQYLHYKIPKYWVVHNTPSGYVDRDC